jgi:predicted DNA-binding transcriptional regulator AlpA
MAKKKTRTIKELGPERLYSLTELRTVWKIRLSNRHLLTLLISGRFPRPQPRRQDGRMVVWSESDIVAWLTVRMRMAGNVKWKLGPRYHGGDDTPRQTSCPMPMVRRQ